MVTFTVSQVARRLGVSPRAITNLFYQRELSDAACPIVRGRRRIPQDYVDTIKHALAEHDLLPESEKVAM